MCIAGAGIFRCLDSDALKIPGVHHMHLPLLQSVSVCSLTFRDPALDDQRFLCLFLRSDLVEKNAMLRTKAMREKEEQRERRKYNYTLLRIRLPDGNLLQGKTSMFELNRKNTK